MQHTLGTMRHVIGPRSPLCRARGRPGIAAESGWMIELDPYPVERLPIAKLAVLAVFHVPVDMCTDVKTY